jgi:hypothetical protein
MKQTKEHIWLKTTVNHRHRRCLYKHRQVDAYKHINNIMKFTKEMNESDVIERKHIYKTTHIQIKLNDKMDG